MEIYKRTVGYDDFDRTNLLVVTGTTLYFPFFLKQNFEDIGIYTDTSNPVYEIVDLSGVWNTTGNTGTSQKSCLTLNNCVVNITETPITYFNANNGSLSALVSGCLAPQTISWVGPNGYTANTLTISNLASGNYTLKVVDANCDITYSTHFLSQPQGLSASLLTQNSQTNATIGCNGSASVTPNGGNPPYTYLWYSGVTSSGLCNLPSCVTYGTSSSVSSLCAGVYTVAIKDASGTQVSQIFTITQPSAISGSVVTTTNINCFGGSTGIIVLTASGGIAPTGYTYTITGPVNTTNTTGTFNNLPSGSYVAQIFDGVGNFTTLPVINITQPTQVSLSLTPTDISCYGSQNGSITLTPSGGVAPYSMDVFLNSQLLVQETGVVTLNNLDVGNYSVTIKDANGCPGPTQSVTLIQRPQFTIGYTLPSPSPSGYDIGCFGGSIVITAHTLYTTSTFAPAIPNNPIKYYLDGVLKATVTGPPAITGITASAGTHILTAVDSGNCSATTVVNITQPPMPLTMTLGIINAEDDTCGTVTTTGVPGSSVICSPCGCGNCRQAIIDINGGVHPYTILWSDGSTLLTSNSHCTGTNLTVTVTDYNGCSITSSTITLV